MSSSEITKLSAGTGRPAPEELPDEEVVRRVLRGEIDLFETLVRRHDQRVYRAVRAVLTDDGDAEDVTQEAWMRAFRHLRQFGHRARFTTWLVRIALHEAWARARRGKTRRSRTVSESSKPSEEVMSAENPERDTLGAEVRAFLEAAIDALPEGYRIVFVLRAVEGLSSAETARSLDTTEDAVKTRLSRARVLLRQELMSRAGTSITGSYPFLGERCRRMVETVMRRVREESLSRPDPLLLAGDFGQES
jgi:RNA polymerase sigma-70 factor (ECF subfamily)